MSRKTLVLGIDGGGTKTLAMAADESGQILAQHETTASNPNVVGVEKSADVIAHLVTGCAEEVRCDVNEFRSIVMGIAGAGRDQDRKRLRDEVLTRLKGQAPSIEIDTDARIALEGAFDGGAGVVVIAGTGSIVVGKNQRNEVLGVGGWGRILGDEGSGYYIGREALVAMTQHFDKRGDAGKLKEVLARKFHWDSRDHIIAAIYRENFDIPSLAPVVIETAANNDVVSQRIIQRAATHLAEQASVIVRQMGILRKIGLVMVGGLVQPGSVYANVLQMKLMKSLPQVEVRQQLHPPVYGAVLLARERLKNL